MLNRVESTGPLQMHRQRYNVGVLMHASAARPFAPFAARSQFPTLEFRSSRIARRATSLLHTTIVAVTLQGLHC